MLSLVVNNGSCSRNSVLDRTETSYRMIVSSFCQQAATHSSARRRCTVCFCTSRDQLHYCPGFMVSEEGRESIRKRQVVSITEHYAIVMRWLEQGVSVERLQRG